MNYSEIYSVGVLFIWIIGSFAYGFSKKVREETHGQTIVVWGIFWPALLVCIVPLIVGHFMEGSAK